MAYNEGASSGNLVLISSQTASGSTDLTFTSGLTGYDKYYLSFNDVTVSNNSASILLTMSVDAGATYLATGYYENGYFSSGGALNLWGQPNINFHYLIYALDNAATASGNGFTTLYNLNSSIFWKNCLTSAEIISAGIPLNLNYGGFLNTASVVNAIKIASDAGTFSGKFKLYGVQN